MLGRPKLPRNKDHKDHSGLDQSTVEWLAIDLSTSLDGLIKFNGLWDDSWYVLVSVWNITVRGQLFYKVSSSVSSSQANP